MEYKKGEITKGLVSGIENYGIFINFEHNSSGLIHISEIDHNFIKDVNNFAKLGDEIYCQIIDIKDNKLILSIKNIDYKNTGKIKKQPKDDFLILKQNLKSWVDYKLAEIEEEENKKTT